MDYLSLLLVIFFFVFPIAVPLIYWYVLKNRDSKIFTYSRHIRRFWSLVIVIIVVVAIYKRLPNFSFELLGEVFSQLIIAFLLWKQWGKTPEQENSEINSPDKT
jgi:hypothetical protein